MRILGEEMVALMTADQLPDGVQVDMAAMPGVDTSDRRSFVSEFDDGYSLAWAIEVGGEDGGRPEIVRYWSGIFNTYYTVDPARGVAIMSFTQLMQGDDAAAYGLPHLRNAVYSALR